MPAPDIARLQDLLDAGLDLGRTFRYGEACVTMREVLSEVAGSRPTAVLAEIAVQAEMTLAFASLESGATLDEAIEGLDRAADRVQEWGLAHLQVAVAQVRGYCLHRSGDSEGALVAWRVDEAAWESADPTDRARLLLNRGATFMEMGNLARAWDDLHRCEAVAVESGAVELAHKARHNRGYLAHLGGDLPTALRLMGTAADVFVDDDIVDRLLRDPLVAMDRARALVEAGLFDEADALLLDAIREFGAGGRWQDQGEAELARARLALLTGQLDLASAAAGRARVCFQQQGNPRWVARAEIVGLAVEVEHHVRGRQSLPEVAELRERVDLVRAQRMAGDVDELDAQLDLMAVELALVADDLDRARAELEDAEPATFAGTSLRLRWHRANAHVAARSGRPSDEVGDLVTSALVELAAQQARLGSLDLRTAIAVHGNQLAAIGIRAALASGDGSTLYGVVEHSKASSTRVAAVHADMPAADRELLARLRLASAALDRLDVDRQPDHAARLGGEISHLMDRLRALEWERDGASAIATIADLDEATNALSNHGATAVSYVVLDHVVHGVRLRDGEVAPVELASQEEVEGLGARVRADLQAMMAPGLPPAIRSVMQQSLRSGLMDLDRLLLAPLEIGDVPMVVVPYGALSVLPWLLVPSRLGRETTLVPCLSRWVSALDVQGEATAQVALMAGPGLLRADDEVAALAAIWPGARVLTGPDATADAAVSALARSPLVHVAAHGHHRDSSPLFSSMMMADGPVFAHELHRDSGAEVVFLSACELGAATVRPADEPLGFTAALLDADVGTVVAGVTRVRDDVAHDVMCAVHGDLAVGASPAQALGSAVATAWEEGAVAPFTCVGAGMRPLSIIDHEAPASNGAASRT